MSREAQVYGFLKEGSQAGPTIPGDCGMGRRVPSGMGLSSSGHWGIDEEGSWG